MGGTTYTTAPMLSEVNSNLWMPPVYDDDDVSLAPNSISIPRTRAQMAAGSSNPNFPLLSSGVYSHTLPNPAGRFNNPNGNSMLGMPMDEIWCKSLKEKLQRKNLDEVNLIFLQLKDHVCELMIHRFGSQVIEKLFEACSSHVYIDQHRITDLVFCLTKDKRKFKDVCLHKHGSRLLLKLLEKLLPIQLKRIASAITHITLALTKIENGNMILRHCFEHFSLQYNKGIFEVIANDFVDIAMDRQGCRLLQQFLFYAPIQFMPNVFMLSKDPYGNYVVQYALSLRSYRLTENIVTQLKGHLFHLSIDKYGSNVVERCLKECDESKKDLIIREICRNDRDFVTVMTHQYGNYVVQCMLKVSQGSYRHGLCDIISRHNLSLHSNTHGKRVLAYAKKGLANKLGTSWD